MIEALTLRTLSPESGDWSIFLDLLNLAALPTSDLQAGSRFFVLEDERGLVGFGGLQGSGSDQLIRSVVVVPGLRHRRMGPALVKRLVEQAKADGAERLWLLTTEADQFFADLGWTAGERGSAPDTVRSTGLFQDICPSTAVLMVRSLI
jgi:amino-acid N-acetyltransferase